MTRSVIMAGLICALSGCVTVNEKGERVDQPSQREQPEGLEPGQLVLGIPTTVDSDDDGIIDTIPVQVFLFATDPAYRLPIWVDGYFEYWLDDLAGERITEWSFTQEETASMRAIGGQIGPAYQVLLTLERDAVARGRARGGWLGCRFVPVTGDPVETDRPKSVVFGSSGRDRVGS